MDHTVISYSPGYFYRKGKSPILILSPDGTTEYSSANDSVELPSPIVTFDSPILLSFISIGVAQSVRDVIDVCHTGRLLLGQKISSGKKKKPWNIWSLLNNMTNDQSHKDKVSRLRRKVDLHDDIEESLLALAYMIADLWDKQKSELVRKDESARYFEVERPMNNICLSAQRRGICVRQDVLLDHLKTVSNSKTESLSSLRLKYKIIDPNKYQDVQNALKNNGFNYSIKQWSNDVRRNELDLLSFTNELPRLLKQYYDASRNKNILLRLGAVGSEAVHPVYRCLGTVTGRITIDSPSLQNLKSSYRDILRSRDGYVFLCPDYRQFEPGILADESGDQELIHDFNETDLYSPLAKQLFGDINRRESAKILFLAFCNGMSFSRLVSLASQSTAKPKRECKMIIDSFIGKYSTMIKWVDELAMLAEKEGKVGTRLGNYRYRTRNTKRLSRFERRWIISQKIQGTASLILKRAIINVIEADKNIEFVLPMHDAVLWQVPKEVVDEKKILLDNIFVDAFKEECPSLSPKVEFKQFSMVGSD